MHVFLSPPPPSLILLQRLLSIFLYLFSWSLFFQFLFIYSRSRPCSSLLDLVRASLVYPSLSTKCLPGFPTSYFYSLPLGISLPPSLPEFCLHLKPPLNLSSVSVINPLFSYPDLSRSLRDVDLPGDLLYPLFFILFYGELHSSFLAEDPLHIGDLR